MVAGATGPVSAGYLFDTTGSYETAFLAVGLLTIAGGFIILLAKPRPGAAAAISTVATAAGQAPAR
jgi:cyanate permease